jgi:Arc/MetJ-type ribon-helix-helix transcriptional regulator
MKKNLIIHCIIFSICLIVGLSISSVGLNTSRQDQQKLQQRKIHSSDVINTHVRKLDAQMLTDLNMIEHELQNNVYYLEDHKDNIDKQLDEHKNNMKEEHPKYDHVKEGYTQLRETIENDLQKTFDEIKEDENNNINVLLVNTNFSDINNLNQILEKELKKYRTLIDSINI